MLIATQDQISRYYGWTYLGYIQNETIDTWGNSHNLVYIVPSIKRSIFNHFELTHVNISRILCRLLQLPGS
jgi:hypothetical protein